MKTMNRLLGWKVGLLGMLLMQAVALAQEGEKDWKWEPKLIGKVEYIPLEQIREFYSFGPIEREGQDILLKTEKVEMKFSPDSRECWINRIKLILRDEVEKADGAEFVSRADLSRLIDPLLRPRFIKDGGPFTTVILDPAFGGKRQGAEGESGTAAQHSLAIAKLARTELEKQGFRVVMTREDDRDLLLADRVKLANAVEAPAIFINITFGSGPRDRKGVATSVLFKPEEGAAEQEGEWSASSVALGMAVHGALVQRLSEFTEDRGLDAGKLSVLSGVHHPRISLNAGYLTNDMDAKLAANEKYTKVLADGLVAGVGRYRSAMQQRRE